MRDSRRTLLKQLSAGALIGAIGPRAFAASDWPRRPVKVIVPFTPGGSTDIAARLAAEGMGRALGQTFIVENRPGAGGNLGLEALARSDNDGYTIGILTTAHPINSWLYKKPGYDLASSFSAIGFLQEGPIMLVVHPSLPVNSLPEFIAYAKARPGKLNFATSGTGNSTHMAGELFCNLAQVQMTHVPYKGSAPAITDTIAGVCELSFDTMISALPHVQAGKLKAIAVTTAKRSPMTPDVPSIAETLPGFDVSAWNGMVAPAGTPKEVIDKLHQAMVQALAAPAVVQRFADMGVTPRAMQPEAFQRFILQEREMWGKTVRAANIAID
ncbi:tripartite tricarboxylate transporter substrate binding protein [Achromobacter denitrificans]|uniref:Bug family tripartite tricarboxylate transporter substrate binding protein n=1 Tax=Achromobacter denitrificans TaxID=32002 RepID=UPI000B48A51E|nr:tripartite tricarboxylate transporter substrate binding protein [Achromobacter denitrificans]MDX3880679.1 tripartite tricarboxylate transporter substrate binding protein [Achromobacter sp.]MBV2160772.1 tripartite tricarboxylate transporter substrate binding protein [Achromobacter denitrificans]MDF3940507.1 tripartite tricarboxylate transporter substrate binding protein [Achromobacter denitrificans]MPT37745.1 tripartite tricarboxylate transporter substrate binding protein [Achromobacter sp.]